MAGLLKDASNATRDATCSELMCRTHCCAAQTTPDCPVCGSNTGECYRPLTLRHGWETKVW